MRFAHDDCFYFKQLIVYSPPPPSERKERTWPGRIQYYITPYSTDPCTTLPPSLLFIYRLCPYHLSCYWWFTAFIIKTINVRPVGVPGTLDWACISDCDDHESVVYQVPGPGVSDRLHVSWRGGHSNWGCQRFSRPRRTVQGTHGIGYLLNRTLSVIVPIFTILYGT